MPARLFACPSCARHVRLTEVRCPFCGAPCPDSFASSAEPVRPPRGLSRAGLVRFNAAAGVCLGVALVIALSCSTEGSVPPGVLDGAAPNCAYGKVPDGGVAVRGACSENAYVQLPSGNVCGERIESPCDLVVSCCDLLETNFDAGTCLCVTYALCVHGSYSACSSTVPDGGVQVLSDGAPVDSGLDSGADTAPLDAAFDVSAPR
jgi:hypothetical protein